MEQWNILRKNLHQTSQFPLLCLKSLFSWVQLKVSCSWWWKMIWGTKGPWRVSIILGLDNTCGGWLVLMKENNKLSWSNCKSIKQLKILSLQCVCMTHPPECRLVIVLLLQYNTLHWPTPLNFVVTQHWTGYLKYWSLQDTRPGGGSNQQHQQQSSWGSGFSFLNHTLAFKQLFQRFSLQLWPFLWCVIGSKHEWRWRYEQWQQLSSCQGYE